LDFHKKAKKFNLNNQKFIKFKLKKDFGWPWRSPNLLLC